MNLQGSWLARDIKAEVAEGIDMEANAEEQAAAWIAMEADVAEHAGAETVLAEEVGCRHGGRC